MNNQTQVQLRLPELADGKPVHELIGRCPPLDLNSSYNYFLLCSHFRQTCVIAEHHGQIVGFLSAYLLPEQPKTLFVWQIAVDASMRGSGLAGKLLAELLERPACRQIQYLETTIAPGNIPSRRVFERLADSQGVAIHESDFLQPHHFGNEGHDEERLIRLGPFQS
ncbi:MAG: diaminobutyrate acetyltransferase [Chromatiales bacterium]|nr:diaminobutyrate acetyltransferase [Gammaproteobacteria bacterium]MBW6476948.1 diaminobutyrate acetyltransferase [Chromatiales bacterium]